MSPSHPNVHQRLVLCLTCLYHRGIGNLIGMPLAISVGRRIVMLVSTAILAVGAILCATEKSYEWHFGARILVGLAAGQSESIVPMITQVSNVPFSLFQSVP